MKSGANKVDQAHIARYAKGDEDNKPMNSKQISVALNIDESCVKAFMPKAKVSKKVASKK